MAHRSLPLSFAGLFLFVPLSTLRAEDATTPVQRGKDALLGRHFTMPTMSLDGYQTAWRIWDPAAKEAPLRYAEAFRERYGLHPAPYPNHDYPMGLRLASSFFGHKALATDCLLCHGGSILGQSYVGLGNTSLDIDALFSELARADGLPGRLPFHFCNVRGTSEAGAFGVYLLGLREPDLSLRSKSINLDLHDDLCEDVPAWWLLKKKKTMYHTGGADARSVRSIMQFMLSPLNSGSSIKREETTFVDIQQYILSLEAPKYPQAIDSAKAARGEKVFVNHCARCHGTYGEKWTYPNKIVPLKEIGTDPTRFNGITEKFGRYYNQTWFAKEKSGWLADDAPARPSNGYQAPPLDGIWATAPYFHNGSVPTVYDVLNSKTRPKIFTRSYRTDQDAFDPVKLGWKVRLLDHGADAKLPVIEQRKVYDTTQPGRGNQGHTYGDELSEEERWAVIEYLKTL
jgi:mono/diheme cytochrome c family protein